MDCVSRNSRLAPSSSRSGERPIVSWNAQVTRASRSGGQLAVHPHAFSSRRASFLARATTKSEFIRLSDCNGIVEAERRVQVVTIEGASNTSSRLVIFVRCC